MSDVDVVAALLTAVVGVVAGADADVEVALPLVASAECAVVSEAASTPRPTAAAVAATPIRAVVRRTRTRAASLARRARGAIWSDCRWCGAMSLPFVEARRELCVRWDRCSVRPRPLDRSRLKGQLDPT